MFNIHVFRNKFFKDNKLTVVFASFVLIICFSFSLYNSLISSYNDYLSVTYGEYDLCVFDASDTDICEAEKKSSVNIFGYIDFGDTVIRVGSMDSDAMNMLALSLPDDFNFAYNGIVIEESVLYLLEYDCEEGDVLSLPIILSDGTEEIHDFIIEAIIPNYTYMTPSDEINPLYGMPGIIVGNTGNISKCDGVTNVLLSISGDKEPDADDYPSHTYVNKAKYNDDRVVFLTVVNIIFILLCLIGFVTVLSFYFAERSKNVEDIFLLKCAGISYKGCIRIKATVLLRSSLIAIIVGLSLGIFSAGIVQYIIRLLYFPFLKFNYSVVFSLLIPILCFLIVAVFFLLGIIKLCDCAPLVRKNKREQSKSAIKINKKIFVRKPILSRSMKDIVYNSADFCGLIVSIFLVFFVTVIIQIAFEGIQIYFSDSAESDYELEVSDGTVFSSLSIPDNELSFTDYEESLIYNCNEVKECYAFSENKFFITDKKISESLRSFTCDLRESYEYSEEAQKRYCEELVKYGYNSSEIMMQVKLLGANDTLISKLTNSGNLCAQNEVIVVCRDREYKDIFKSGDEIIFSAPRKIDDEIVRISIETVVYDCVYIGEDKILDNVFGVSSVCFVVKSSTLKYETGNGNDHLLISLKSSDKYMNIEHILGQLESIHSKSGIWNYESLREENEKRNNLMFSFLFISFITVFLLVIYSFSSVIISLSNDFVEHKRVWGYLRAVSLTEKQAFIGKYTSFVIATLCGFMSSVFIFSVILFFLERESATEILKMWKPIYLLLPAALLLILGCIVIRVCIKQYWKKSVIELIHSDN